MNKFLLFALFSFLVSINSHGQSFSKKVDLTFGKEQEESRRSTLSDIVGYDDNGFYAIKTFIKGLYGGKSYITLEYYNQKMNFVKSVKIDLKKDGKTRVLEGVFQLKNKIYLLTSYKDQKAKINYLYLQRFKENTLQLSTNSKKIAEINYAGNTKRNSGDFSYSISRDDSKVLIYYNLPYEKGKEEKFGFHVYNSRFDELWQRGVTLPYKEELFEVEDFKVDNNGNAQLLGIIYDGKRKSKRKGKPNYKYQILSYTENGNTLTEYPIEIKDNFLTDMQIAITDDQNIICSGFYSKDGTFSIAGSYFLKIDNETKVITQKSFKEFGIDFVTQNFTAKQEKRATKKAEQGKSVELYNYALDDIVLREDGGAMLIGEQYFVSTRNFRTSNGAIITTYIYHYNDIIVVNISPTGEINWAKKIPKRQITTNDGGFYSSYALSVVKDKMYFVFNDHPQNAVISDNKKLQNFRGGRGSIAVMVELNAEGKLTKEALFSAAETDVLIRPKVCEQIRDDELVLFGQRRKKHKFIKAVFK